MERLLLYWDDLDDLVGMIGLVAERLRRLLFFLAGLVVFCSVAAGGIALALIEPPLALAGVTLTFVTLMYRSVTTPRFGALRK